MSKLDKMIAKLCPDGVEYKTISELFNTRNGYTPSKAKKEYWINGTIPWFRMEDIRENGQILSKAMQYVSESAVKGSPFPANSIIVATSATIGEHALIKVPSLANQRFTYLMLKDEYKAYIDIMFIYYYCFKLDEYCKACLNHGNFASVDMRKFVKFKFPVPPLEVQREIVRVLDSFTLLTAELTAELTARKKQYEFYREQLLNFEDVRKERTHNVIWRTLGEIAKFTYGYTDTAKEAGSVRFVRITDISEDGTLNPHNAKHVELTEENRKYLLNKGDLLLARTGATYGKTLYFDSNEPAVYASFLIKLTLDKNLIRNRYYWHFSKSPMYWMQAEKYVSKGGQQQFNAKAAGKIEIPIPPLDIQDRIISVLDNFEAICTDLNIGLPAEIEARQKQYEYYRDLLLTFAESGNMLVTDRQTDRQTKLAGFEFTKYVTYSDEGQIIALRGLNVKNGKLDLNDVKYIDKSDLSKLTRSKLCIGDMLFTYVGTIGQVALIEENDRFYLAPNVALVRVEKPYLKPEFMRYYFQTSMFWASQIKRLLQSSSMKNIPMEKIRKFVLPIPPLEEQEKIVNILDRFDTLCNDLSEGLPAEIEARRRQYEYYRDKLLSFEELQKK